MRDSIVTAIKVVAGITCLCGVIMFFLSTNYIDIFRCIACVTSSFVIFGFSIIVEAAAKYLDRCEIEEQEKSENN